MKDKTDENNQPLVFLPNAKKKLLLHSCCAPCCGNIMQRLNNSNIDYQVLFYNPNIYPLDEYEKRKKEIKNYSKKMGVGFIDLDYDNQSWLEKTKGYESEKEGGKRCALCFEMRLETAAKFAHENGFDIFTSSLGASRWKNLGLINEIGKKIAGKYKKLDYFDFDWRKKNGTNLLAKRAKEQGFYIQQYCGCIHSLEQTNQRREKNNQPKIIFD